MQQTFANKTYDHLTIWCCDQYKYKYDGWRAKKQAPCFTSLIAAACWPLQSPSLGRSFLTASCRFGRLRPPAAQKKKTPPLTVFPLKVRILLCLHCCLSLQQQRWCPVAYLHPSFKHCPLCQPSPLLLPPSRLLLLLLLDPPSLSPCTPKSFC